MFKRNQIYACLGIMFTFCFTLLVNASNADLNPLSSQLSHQDCSLWTDAHEVPHIRANNDIAAYACWGYLHGRDRSWQMDYFRRVTQGTLSEVLGPKKIKTDFLMRILGLNQRAQHLYEELDNDAQKIFWAYTHGVNLGFKEALKKDAYEFETLGYHPKAWHPADSIAILLLQAFDQTKKTFQEDVKEEKRLEAHGQDAASLFNDKDLPWTTSILKTGEYAQKDGPDLHKKASTSTQDSDLDTSLFENTGIHSDGSNNWVLSPSRSANNHAWLANDPHLTLSYPPFWYWAHVKGTQLNVIGASLPGIPVVVSGANATMSWGLTNSYMDVADVFRIPESEMTDVQTFRPVIWVKVWKLKLPFLFKTFQRLADSTPILPLKTVPGHKLVLRWSGFDLEADDLVALFKIMSSRTVHEMDTRLGHIGLPSWNFVFADVKGNIGFRTVGKVPQRLEQDTFGITPASLKNLKSWTYLNERDMPHVINPSRGYVATANNRQWGPNSKFDAGRSYRPSFRAFRIEELLNQTPRHDKQSIQSLQCDHQAVDARFFVPLLLKRVHHHKGETLTTLERNILNQLQRWDYQTNLECRACGFYRRWMDVLKDSLHVTEPALYRILTSNHTQDKVGTSLMQAFHTAVEDLDIKTIEDLPTWGSIHQIAFEHLSKSSKLAHPESIPTVGDKHSVNPGNADWKEHMYKHTSGASQRLIVSLDQTPKVYRMLSGPNKDYEQRKMLESNSPWKKWAACKLEEIPFPIAWDQKQKDMIQL